MNFSSKILEEAVKALSGLPGIGKKSELRLALHLVQDDTQKAQRIAQSLTRLSSEIKKCRTCHGLSDEDVCQICSSPSRKKNVLCVVESIRDVMAIEETQQYSGLYHVLGGIISPLDGVGPDNLTIDELIQRLETGQIEEIIMAISPSIEGETTIYYIGKLLQDKNIRISVIARGVSFGGELEYADEFTLGRSIVSRIPYSFQS